MSAALALVTSNDAAQTVGLAVAAAPAPVGGSALAMREFTSAEMCVALAVTPGRVSQLVKAFFPFEAQSLETRARLDALFDTNPKAARTGVEDGSNVIALPVAQAGVDEPNLSPEQWDRVAAKKEWIERYQSFARRHPGKGVVALQDEWCRAADGIEIRGVFAPSRPTLRSWLKAYAAQGLHGLVDGRMLIERERNVPEPLGDEFRAWFLHENRTPARTAYNLFVLPLADELGIDCPSFDTIWRWFKETTDPATIEAQRKGLQAFMDNVLPFCRRDYSKLPAGAWYCSDHHRLDFFVWDPKVRDEKGNYRAFRPWLTTIIDLRSHMPVGWVIRREDPDANVVLEAFGYACLEFGLPKVFYCDNGKDYRAKTVTGGKPRRSRRGEGADEGRRLTNTELRDLRQDIQAERSVMRRLDVSVTFAHEYNAKAKPIERWHVDVIRRFAKLVRAGYCGSDTTDKPERLAWELAVPQDRLMTFAEAWALMDGFLRSDMRERTLDREGGKRAIDVFNEHRMTPRILPVDRLVFDVLPGQQVKVVSDHTGWGVKVFNRFYVLDNWNESMWGRTVEVRWDKRDMSRVYVFDLQGIRIGEATNPELAEFAENGRMSETTLEHMKATDTRRKAAIKKQRETYRELEGLRAESRARRETRLRDASVDGGEQPTPQKVVEAEFGRLGTTRGRMLARTGTDDAFVELPVESDEIITGESQDDHGADFFRPLGSY
jgi:hypothetical protein